MLTLSANFAPLLVTIFLTILPLRSDKEMLNIVRATSNTDKEQR